MSAEDTRGKYSSRALQMLRAMMAGKPLDAQSVATAFSIRPEVALRYLKQLKKEIPGVLREDVGSKHVFRFDPEKAFAKSLAKEEHNNFARVISASLGAAFSKVFTGTRYQIDLESIRTEAVQRFASVRKQKLSSMNRKFLVLCSHEALLGDRVGDLDDVLEAILSQRLIDMQYQTFGGREDQRTIKPYTLVVHEAQLYVVGIDPGGEHPETPKTFRFARMRSISLRRETFDYPELNEYDPAVLFRDSIGIWLGEPQPCTIKVRLSRIWATYALHHRWHASQKTRQLADGGVEVELLVRPCPELEQWVLHFGEDAEVLEPRELREKVEHRLQLAASRYAEMSRQ